MGEADLAAAKQAVANGQANEAIDFCERLVKTVEELARCRSEPVAKRGDHGRGRPDRATRCDPRRASRGNSPWEPRVVFEGAATRLRLRASPTWLCAGPACFVLETPLEVEDPLPLRPLRWSNVSSEPTSTPGTNSAACRSGSCSTVGTGRPSGKSVRSWHETQPSIPSLSAFTASRCATDSRRRREFERVLYDDAQATLGARVQASLRGFPKVRVSPS